MFQRPSALFSAAVIAVTSASFALAGCAHSSAAKEATPVTTAAATSGACSEQPGNTVVASYGEDGKQTITLAELDSRLKEQLSKLEQQKYEIRRRGLDNLIVEKLVQAEARRQGETDEGYLKKEIEDKINPPTEAQIQEVFEQNRDKLPAGTTLEKIRPQIEEYLTNEKKQSIAVKLFTDLKKKGNVTLSLPMPEVERKEVAATGPARGPENAPVTIVEFTDFQCPFCARALPTIEQIHEEYGDKVRIVFRNFPLEFHANAQKAAEAAQCARDQGKFWEMHNVLFAHQKALSPEDLHSYAKELGLDTEKFNQCLDSGEKAGMVKADAAEGSSLGVTGTPAFFINGIGVTGAQPFDEFKAIIDAELQGKTSAQK